MTYFAVAPLALVATFAGSRAALVVLLFTIGAVFALAAARIARAFSLGWIAWFALTFFLTFNTFTYTKLVAGHLTQTLAIAGLAIFWAELVARKPSRSFLVIGAILSALQTQFFLLIVVAGLVFIKRRGVPTAIALSSVVFLPTIVGIVADAHALLGWPMTVAWENEQSVPIGAAFLLGGFFARYDVDLARIAAPAVAIYLVLSVIALAAVRRREVTLSAVVVVLVAVVAAGTHGPLSLVWRWAIVHAPVVGVYRELYDLIGVLAVGYTVLAAAAMELSPKLRIAAVVGSLGLFAAWIAVPPDRFWVAADALPAPPAGIDRVERFALFPAFQPLSLSGRGSGGDPLLLGTAPDNVSLNAMLSDYPADVALARYERTGDVAALARLGVGMIVCRRGLAPAEGSRAFYGTTGKRCSAEPALAGSAPLLGIETGEPDECSLCSNAGAGNLLIGDGSRGWWQQIAVPRIEADPRAGWIDARLQFAQKPQLGQPFGGAYTEQSHVPIDVARGPALLANVRGELRSVDGLTRFRGTGTYRWYPLPSTVVALQCFGSCLIAAIGDPASVPLEGSPMVVAPIPVIPIVPWLLTARLPPHSNGVVRLIETYDPSWTAFAVDSRRVLPHVRLDGIINGWRVNGIGGQLVIVEVAAALQCIAAICGGSMLLAVIVAGLRGLLQASSRRSIVP